MHSNSNYASGIGSEQTVHPEAFLVCLIGCLLFKLKGLLEGVTDLRYLVIFFCSGSAEESSIIELT